MTYGVLYHDNFEMWVDDTYDTLEEAEAAAERAMQSNNPPRYGVSVIHIIRHIKGKAE